MVTLYKKGGRGQTLVWSIWNEDDVIIFASGQQGGTMTETQDFVLEGKAGRTIEEQVELKMNSRINNKKKSGYVEDIKDLENSGKNLMGQERQMKAVLLKDGMEPNIKYDDNAFVQRKYNGHRCTIGLIGGRVQAYSSGGKPITSIGHILKRVQLREGQKLDGELYIHGLSLQKISSRVRKENVTDESLKFVVFDSISDKPFPMRIWEIDEANFNHDCIVKAGTYAVSNFEDVKALFVRFRGEGYEGAMLRHGTLGYEAGKRGKQIYKIKKIGNLGYEDEDFEIIDVLPSKEGWGRLVCRTPMGKEFKMSAPGDHDEKREILKNKEKYIGQFAKTEFPEWTDAHKPSQPVALMIRPNIGED